MKKIIFIIGIVAVIGIGMFALINQSQNQKTKSSKLKVVTTIFPLYEMAKNIGGENAEVSSILPPGVEAHAFEPKPSDIARINEADIFVYTGKFMEPWAEDIIKSVTNKNLIVVDASTGIAMNKEEEGDEHEHEAEVKNHADEEAGHEHGGVDPHIWLDFDNAKVMTENIKRGFIQKNPENKTLFEGTAREYASKLTGLDTAYRQTLATCKSKTIVYGGHYAFGYLAKKYGLVYLAAQGLAPDAEPTAKDLASLVDQIKKENIGYIFYEELASPKIAETIAGETKAKMLLLHAVHNLTKDERAQGRTFLSIMTSNLESLKTGLDCK